MMYLGPSMTIDRRCPEFLGSFCVMVLAALRGVPGASKGSELQRTLGISVYRHKICLGFLLVSRLEKAATILVAHRSTLTPLFVETPRGVIARR